MFTFLQELIMMIKDLAIEVSILIVVLMLGGLLGQVAFTLIRRLQYEVPK